MDYVIEREGPKTFIGFAESIPEGKGYEQCPKFWDKLKEEHFHAVCQGKKPETAIERAIMENNIGMFGVCIQDEADPSSFTYMVAGPYNGGPVPDGLTVREIPAATWAKFRAVGPLPGSLQSINTQIFQEWLPGNPDYELAFPVNLELYDSGDTGSAGYRCYIWLPVTEKEADQEN